MALAADKVVSALIAKGAEQSDGDHKMFKKHLDGVTTVITKVSHGRRREVSDQIAAQMARQCCLQLAEFKRLVSCELSEEDWDRILRERCADGRNPLLFR